MTAPTSAAAAVSKTVRAMSNVWARMLIAGTVNPWTSPRARAMYRSWMLAERAPSSWLASQTSQRATSTVASSAENAEVQARSRIVRSRKAAASSMTSRSPSRWADPGEEIEELGDGGGDGRHEEGSGAGGGWTPRRCVPRRTGAPGSERRASPPSATRSGRSGRPVNIPPRWILPTVAATSGGGPAGAAPGGGGVEVSSTILHRWPAAGRAASSRRAMT